MLELCASICITTRYLFWTKILLKCQNLSVQIIQKYHFELLEVCSSMRIGGTMPCPSSRNSESIQLICSEFLLTFSIVSFSFYWSSLYVWCQFDALNVTLMSYKILTFRHFTILSFQRFALAAAELNGAIYAVGGSDGQYYLK